jgi:hypothetical protein
MREFLTVRARALTAVTLPACDMPDSYSEQRR